MELGKDVEELVSELKKQGFAMFRMPPVKGKECRAILHSRKNADLTAAWMQIPSAPAAYCVYGGPYHFPGPGLVSELAALLKEAPGKAVLETPPLPLPFEEETPGMHWSRIEGDFLMRICRRVSLRRPEGDPDSSQRLRAVNVFCAVLESISNDWEERLLDSSADGGTPSAAVKNLLSRHGRFKAVFPRLSPETRAWLAES
ncbi:MAG: hypothetical protein J6Y62_10090 [Clostridia bacterium]|nr:hypothetical protein [Clostridia bacterium]